MSSNHFFFKCLLSSLSIYFNHNLCQVILFLRNTLDFYFFPVKRSFCFSIPVILKYTIKVTRSLLCLPPKHFRCLKSNVLFGKHLKNKSVSSTLKISFGTNFSINFGKTFNFQLSQSSYGTSTLSPQITLYRILCLDFNLSDRLELSRKST